MYLIDSSAWIEYLRPQGSPSVKERVREILKREEAVTCGVVVVEIIRGPLHQKQQISLKEALLALPQIDLDSGVFERAGEWGFRGDRQGKNIPTTDLLIGAAAYKKATVLHCDKDFEFMSSAFGLEQEYCR
ncbi:MAG: PIN domain-containing protein [Thermodesulfobacteriota bacterium]